MKWTNIVKRVSDSVKKRVIIMCDASSGIRDSSLASTFTDQNKQTPPIRYPIPSEETGNTQVIPLELRMSMDSAGILLSNDCPARLPLEDALAKFRS
ncbi:hypothetical protein EVAR_40815_1 [Eumeta japonica]|uniref:Uncharacterized protein n=1 Tax=Eumeta variegata TaxID=151549 RepID=A0A4C1WGR5_EUMVA|nr:hypothetical protein EVAR_40815_1 [Eumeta japonica]